LRLSYSQFEELERFSRFGTRLDKETRETLAHGHRVREILKQDQYCPIPVTEQIAALFAVSEGVLDGVPLEAIRGIEERIANTTREEHADLQDRVSAGNELSEEDRETLAKVARAAVKESNHADPTGHEEAD
jgi:F-type H+-transporting ATPase subunit alpha